MTDDELIVRDEQRDLGAELLASVKQMKAAERRVDVSEVAVDRQAFRAILDAVPDRPALPGDER